MKITFLVQGNYPFTPQKIYKEGVGGAELILMLLGQALAAMGHEVQVYNDCADKAGVYDEVTYLPLNTFDGNDFTNVLVVWRVSYHGKVNADRLIFFSTDQYTDNQWGPFLLKIDRMICISEYHRNYIASHYTIDPSKLSVVYPGVNLIDYADAAVPKVPNKMIFCSVPHRGLKTLLQLWPKIRLNLKSPQLVITSDYRLWGTTPNNQEFVQLAQLPGVRYYGKIPRAEMVWHQMTAELMPYPCTYEECFCIAAAECLTAGAVPVTTKIGALQETVYSAGVLQDPPGSPSWSPELFVDTVCSLLSDNRDELRRLQVVGRQQAGIRFGYSRVAKDFLQAVEL